MGSAAHKGAHSAALWGACVTRAAQPQVSRGQRTVTQTRRTDDCHVSPSTHGALLVRSKALLAGRHGSTIVLMMTNGKVISAALISVAIIGIIATSRACGQEDSRRARRRRQQRSATRTPCRGDFLSETAARSALSRSAPWRAVGQLLGYVPLE